MKNIEDIAVIVQARLSSERCPRKMVRPFAGSTLTDIICQKILKSKIIPKDNFYLAVNEPELVEIGKRNNVNVFLRSKESAIWAGGPDAKMTGMYEWWDKIPFKYVILVNACVPFLTTDSIDDFFKAYSKSDSDGMFAVMEKMNYFWNDRFEFLTPLREDVMNTKNVQKTYEAAHCLYASRLDTIGEGKWMGDFNKIGDIELYPISERECFDVDYEWQFNIFEAMYKALEI